MNRFFEYFYYRIAKLNFKGNNPERAIISVTITQSIIILNVIMGLILYIFPEIKRKFNIFEILFILLVFFGLDYYNNKIYKGRYDEFNERWSNESKTNKIINMFFLILFIIFSWGLIFIFGWINGRFNPF
ncbi:hypothetical protein OX284_012140 [Flavobacterium sp. SUN046]|uniref:hypothetical protein n=1 Tax=Flavobacterium sp. SUN046 TaxID=3002440 RepID=UPI002DBF2652|nr:hypothetical protein [Flavobacterium sp. SUN046]MEC4050184.1 hypothetical protein [Flavobacterium sp. SUN046]